MVEARQSMGICPQHNVLFPELTVSEHLDFFNRIKGISTGKKSIQKAAKEVGLGDKMETLSGALSGGMKRKLSVAISLCGDPKFLLLDEPTSGMDPYSRRATWELLRKSKKGRVTLLTTHFMDEAEVLSDRIAVLKSGRLQCVGSSLFLKKRFGIGYNLTLVANLMNDSTVDRTRTFINEFVQNATMLNLSGKEMSFRLPSGSETNFPAMFDEFEQKGGMREELGIGGYGISITTLEEVFIRLGKEEEVGGGVGGGVGDGVLSLDDLGRLSGVSSGNSTPGSGTPRRKGSFSQVSPLNENGVGKGAMDMSKLGGDVELVDMRRKGEESKSGGGVKQQQQQHSKNTLQNLSINSGDKEKKRSFTSQLKILFKKRLLIQKRDKKVSHRLSLKSRRR